MIFLFSDSSICICIRRNESSVTVMEHIQSMTLTRFKQYFCLFSEWDSGWEFLSTSRGHANIRNKDLHSTNRENFFPVLRYIFVFLCFKNYSQYLGSTFSQQITLSSSSKKLRWSRMNYLKLLATSAFLEPKKLLSFPCILLRLSLSFSICC